MAEYLDILNEHGEKTGQTMTYDAVHAAGAIHRTVHAWLVNSRGQILLQKRSANKRAYPSMWDISVGGHISAGQTSLEAAKRETEEELGLTLPDSAFSFMFTIRQPRIIHGDDFIDDEFNDVYVVHCDAAIQDLKLPPDEVEEARWLDIEEFKKWVNGSGGPLVPHPEEYKRLLEHLGQ